jgi:hypothetical protein
MEKSIVDLYHQGLLAEDGARELIARAIDYINVLEDHKATTWHYFYKEAMEIVKELYKKEMDMDDEIYDGCVLMKKSIADLYHQGLLAEDGAHELIARADALKNHLLDSIPRIMKLYEDSIINMLHYRQKISNRSTIT